MPEDGISHHLAGPDSHPIHPSGDEVLLPTGASFSSPKQPSGFPLTIPSR